MPARVFISYSRRDERYKNEVVQQLRVLERQGLLSTWSDEQIAAGSRWHEELIRELEAATVVVLLVTANFLTSDFILREEVPRALKAHKNLKIVPTLCRPCAWEAIDWLRVLQVWPRTGQPLWMTETDDPAAQLADLAREIARQVGTPILNAASVSLPSASPAASALENEIRRLQSQGSCDVESAAGLVRSTIGVGAPLYNGGDIAGCAALYRRTISSLDPLTRRHSRQGRSMRQSEADVRSMDLPHRPRSPSGMPGSNEREQHDSESPFKHPLALLALEREVSGALATTPAANDDQSAWQLRRCFNRILGLHGGLSALAEANGNVTGFGSHMGLHRESGGLRVVLERMDGILDEAGHETNEDYAIASCTCAVLGLLACETQMRNAFSAPPLTELAERRLGKALAHMDSNWATLREDQSALAIRDARQALRLLLKNSRA